MDALTQADRELIAAAESAIAENYDAEHGRHTVGCALRAGSGKIYRGVNVYSVDGACAEQVAVGAAVLAGERVIESVAAVRGGESFTLLAPCGSCRQMLFDMAPGCRVLVPTPQGPRAAQARELLPFAYRVPD